ncbi:hypothetical protein M405DRAFT_864089 [Rhizopogon salebrosus TDB-379]|nr:hypothetical protein M405DRAFT_864089 [Rhizopogon salebrosus TDB-379]
MSTALNCQSPPVSVAPIPCCDTKKSPACKSKQEESAPKGPVAGANEPGPSTASGSSSMASPSVTVPTGQFTFQAPMPSTRPSSLVQQAPPLPVCTPASQPAAQVPRTVLNAVPKQASGAPPLPVFAQDAQIIAQTSRPEPLMVSQHGTGVPPPPIVAANFSINAREREDDDDMGLFGSPKMSNFLALPQAQVVQEGIADMPAGVYDESVLSTSFDDWFKEAENALPAVYADSTMDAFTFF